MKKITLTLLAFYSIGMSHQITTSFEDVFSSFPHIAGLRFQVENPEDQTRKVRIGFQFFGLEGQKYYISNGCDSVPYVVNETIKKKNYEGIEDAQINFSDISGTGSYLVDIMFDMPQGKKDFCITLRENDFNEFKQDEEGNGYPHTYDMSVDGERYRFIDTESPIKNKITYNYVPRLRAAGQSQLKKGASFEAKTMYDAETPGLTEEKRFSVYIANSFKNVPAKVLVDLNVESYGAYKDTRMLMPTLGGLVDQFRWNESTFDGHQQYATSNDERLNYNLFGRCWAIAAFNVYSYLYGNRNTQPDALTQDEIVYMGKVTLHAEPDPIMGVFMPRSENESESLSAELINKVMYGADAVSHSATKEPLNGEKLYNLIKEDETGKGKPLPIVVTEGPHALVIDGMAITDDAKKDTLVHLINLENYGTEGYVYLKTLQKVLREYVTYNTPNGFAKTDALHPVDVDSDGDGVVDFDEFYRFKTNENKYSTANDGLSDYERLYLEYSKKNIAFDEEGEVYYHGIKNGDSVDIPDDVTLYALSYLVLEDSVSCYTNNLLKIGCTVASEADNRNVKAVDEGRGALVNAIYSKSGVTVRAGATVGNIAIYTENKKAHYVSCQDDDVNCPQYIYYPNVASWPFNVKKNVDDISKIIGTEEKVVKSGESFTISDEEGHDNFSSLKVEKGGRLVIGTGKIYLGSIQLDSGSSFMFEHPAYMTELHLNGNVAWHGKYEENPNVEYKFAGPSEKTAAAFKLIQHSDAEMEISSTWHGTIVAPYSIVSLGSASESRKIYGQIFAYEIFIREGTFVQRVRYSPKDPALLKKDDESEGKTTTIKMARPDAKIMNVTRNEINFTVMNPGVYKISIMKLDGSVISSFAVDQFAVGAVSVGWNGANVPKGAYVLSIKNDGKTYSKIFSLM